MTSTNGISETIWHLAEIALLREDSACFYEGYSLSGFIEKSAFLQEPCMVFILRVLFTKLIVLNLVICRYAFCLYQHAKNSRPSV